MNHGASLFCMYSDWLVDKSAGKDTQSFLNDNAKSEKNAILLSNSFCQQLVMIPLVAEETILVALGVDNSGVVRLLFFIETAADGHLLVTVRL